ncbi:isochorismatase family protein [Burkholderia alba]|uniref:isochorismatase family protein n=1 Tax=Burkholderia alba TaxID=2683677 RepID=UPI002B05E2FF|nr:isochorismatase family protein [Burkholderia alba]
MALPSIKHYDPPVQPASQRAGANWRVDAGHTALLIHDMQRYFLRGYESVEFVERLVGRIVRLRAQCDALGIPVYYTAQPGDQRPEDRGLLCDVWGPGLSSRDEDVSIVDALAPRPHDVVMTKHRYSAYAKSDFLDRLRAADTRQLVVCGVYAHIGCLVTATETFMADIQPFFVADALGDFSREHHQLAIDYVASLAGRVLTTDALCAEFARARGEAKEMV